LEVYFADLVESHSWSTVKIDRLGLQFFWKHVLKLDWQWVTMGLHLGEALSLQVGDIDSGRKRVHIRRGKGHKDRLVPLPDLTLRALRELWARHRHPKLIFPNANGSLKTIQKTKNSYG